MLYIDHGQVVPGIECRELDEPHFANEQRPVIAIYSDTKDFRGLARGLVGAGYNVKRYVTREQAPSAELLGRLAVYLAADAKPNVAIIHVRPENQQAVLGVLDGNVQLLVLENGANEGLSVSESTILHKGRLSSTSEIVPLIWTLLGEMADPISTDEEE